MASEKRLIDANALKEILQDEMKKVDFRLGEYVLQKFCDILDKSPTVDAVEVVHGRWVMRGGKRYCSACQQRACVTRDSDDFWYTVGTAYCPNCGAKMDLK